MADTKCGRGTLNASGIQESRLKIVEGVLKAQYLQPTAFSLCHGCYDLSGTSPTADVPGYVSTLIEVLIDEGFTQKASNLIVTDHHRTGLDYSVVSTIVTVHRSSQEMYGIETPLLSNGSLCGSSQRPWQKPRNALSAQWPSAHGRPGGNGPTNRTGPVSTPLARESVQLLASLGSSTASPLTP